MAAMHAMPNRLFANNRPKRKPNFVFLFIDDLGWKDVGFMGSQYYETPNIDNLSQQGMHFTNAYANAPNCAPSRACLLSGQYSPRHGVYTVGSSERGRSENRKLIPVPNNTTLSPEVVTLAEALKKAGYVSAHVGKWHLGNDPDSGPIAQGFDVNIAGNRAGSPASYFSPFKNPNLNDGANGEYLPDRLTDEAIHFIEANRNKPFFLYFAHYSVHTPLKAKETITQKYRQKTPTKDHNNPTYAAMIESTDQSVGRILQKLDELDLSNDTVVVFFSDNGGYGPATSMAPLRGAKGMMYEGGIRVPMIVRWPENIKPGSICIEPVIGIDFYPTFLDIANVPRDSQHILDGKSMVPLLKQSDTFNRDAIFWHFPAYLGAYRNSNGIWRTTPASAIRQGDFKLVEFFEDSRLELYNLKNDIGEKNNLADTLQKKRDELHKKLLKWREEMNAPVPVQNNPEYVSD